ncbi:hypothetical protein B1B04_10440 [Lysinibacillus sp. KCTC 33748]|uniref:hypothetical protein n=1 Tax=unclassified Lysinibacillus TaxID=2636778 RepID=UPI0009A5FF7D|nr:MULTISPECIES: hypothetical protein [unclassified Lysinibacillus]OXS74023.1 hypothetical protein B1B04_10440 [Lysinibacillus sp. KCTC 33748]SKB69348.1 hypothetical protein SAMN06295926_10646 [Lysinibacillus sp. AC-3]
MRRILIFSLFLYLVQIEVAFANESNLLVTVDKDAILEMSLEVKNVDIKNKDIITLLIPTECSNAMNVDDSFIGMSVSDGFTLASFFAEKNEVKFACNPSGLVNEPFNAEIVNGYLVVSNEDATIEKNYGWVNNEGIILIKDYSEVYAKFPNGYSVYRSGKPQKVNGSVVKVDYIDSRKSYEIKYIDKELNIDVLNVITNLIAIALTIVYGLFPNNLKASVFISVAVLITTGISWFFVNEVLTSAVINTGAALLVSIFTGVKWWQASKKKDETTVEGETKVEGKLNKETEEKVKN